MTRRSVLVARAAMLAIVLASAAIATCAAEEPTAGATTSAAKPAPPPTLYNIVPALARVDAMQRDIEASLRDTAAWASLTKPLDAPALAPSFHALENADDAVTRVRYMELRALDVHLRERLRETGEATAAIAALAQKFVAHVDRIDGEAALWPERAKLARDAQAPAELQRSVDAVAPQLAELRERVIARRDQLLVAYERAERLQTRLEAIRADVAQRRERLWSKLRHSIGAPIWRQANVPLPLDELSANASLLRLDLAEWAAFHGTRIAAWFIAVLALAFAMIRRPLAVPVRDAHAPVPAGVALCAAIVVAIVASAAFAPSGAPLAFYRLSWFTFPLFAAAVATYTFARAVPATTWTATLALFLNEFGVIAEMNPLSNWLLLMLQIVPFGVALVRDYRSGALARAFPHAPTLALRSLVQIELALLAVALALGMTGYIGLAAIPVGLAVIVPGFALSFRALAWSVNRVVSGLLATTLAQTLRSVREQRGTILRTTHRLVSVAAFAGGVATFALSYSALDDVQRAIAKLADTSVSVGDVTITLRAVATAAAVIALTWLATRLVRFLLDHEVLPRLRLRTGVPIAISTIAGYMLVVIGAVLALAALGIDLTKVTLLAGALGIGVGLGLQNVVNNFASGLILMFERPINVGDQVDVGGVVGEVKRIGVRSSTIRTFQGAEIIVPNADLVSKQVTNWTLSDRARRYDIDVGVAYGSDPTQVIKLLEQAAASVPEVQKQPAPRAAFTSFGDNALDFRVYAWVESVDVGIQAQNGLRTAILQALDSAGIDIPFPQREVRIRYSPDMATARKLSAEVS